MNNGVSSVAIQNVAENSTAGKILLAGDMDNGSDHDFFLARYNASGQLDKNFGEDGFVTTGINISLDDYASSVAVQNNGKIVVAGSALKIDGTFEFALIRYNVDGTFDNTFGTSGIVTTSIGTSNCLALSSAIQEDGKIIVVGRSGNSSYNYFVFTIVRYEGDSPATLKTEKSNEEPLSYKLDQNYPNPFNPATNIEFRISDFGFVTLKVYDVLGREVATLVNGEKSPGAYKVKFNAQQTINNKQLSSGVYFYRLKCGDFVQTKKMILLR
ncbi:MAG: T9SS type A sorting domain-containing protein [Ignavibacteriaceae bacterium]